MSESNSQNARELAELLWEKQGRPVDHTTQGWLEGEYRAHPPAFAQRPNVPESEVDLRMRGLGPLSRSETCSNGEVAGKLGKSTVMQLCLAGVGLAVAAGMMFSFSHKRR